ncbi:MAG: putative multidrug export ATP-binding/permease protein [Candidatus Heimdallarchaeota archaeon LC_2]|nr:MAG: putative multidrug export ATP-binding/permease protein [Candidatus Heimdallarchaeota archaeon LC_2]
MNETTASMYLDDKYYEKSHRYWMWGHVSVYRKKIIVIAILTIIAIVVQTAIPLIFGRAIDDAIPNKDTNKLLFFSLIIIGFGFARGILTYIAGILNEQVSQNVEMNVRLELFDNLSKKNMDFFNKARVGDLMSRATQDTSNLTFAVSPGIRAVIAAVFGFIAAGIAMFTLSPTLSVVFIIILPFYIFFMYRYAISLQPVSLERQERLARIQSVLQENITGIRVVRTFSAQKTEKKLFEEDIRAYESILIRRGAISALFIPTLLLGLVTSIIFLFGVSIIEADAAGQSELSIFGLFSIPVESITIGDLIAFITLTGLLFWPTSILRFLLDATMLGFAGAQRIYFTLKTEAQLQESKDIKLDQINGKVKFNAVNFSYEDNGFKVINDFTLEIEPGETVAIIGATGSGKSTVGRLLLRLYDIDDGSIEIDGMNIADLNLNQLRQIVGIIEQDIYLFSTSIKANIAYGAHDIGEKEIIDAAKAAQAHDFITNFKEGYDTIIGERGITLSGGQRQRVAMARTFVTDPKILIMDDSTSAVDAKTESKIQAAMSQLLKDRTTIIITHRLSTLKNSDKIVFMDKGKIVTMGTHEELLSSFEPYRQIFEGYMSLPPIKEEDE